MVIFHSYVSLPEGNLVYIMALAWPHRIFISSPSPHHPVLSLEEMGVSDQLEEDKEYIHDKP